MPIYRIWKRINRGMTVLSLNTLETTSLLSQT